MSEDWDLNAVVRSCKSTTTPKNDNQTTISRNFASTSQNRTNKSFPFLNDAAFEELQQQFFFYKPPNKNPDLRLQSPPIFPAQPAAAHGVAFQPPKAATADSGRNINAMRSRFLTHQKKKKNQVKKIVRTLTKEKLYNDFWSWRKYGQKPIKGSPHPRNYYRCSSWRGCPARKQVERSQKSEELYVVTYTCEHSHPRPEDDPDFSSENPPPPPTPPAPAVAPPPPTPAEDIDDEEFFLNLDDVDLFDGFFFDM